MHELSIAVGIVEAAEEEAAQQGASSVAAVHLKLGPLSGVVREALEFSYGIACEGTPLAGSRLVIHDMPVIVFCTACGENRAIVSMQAFRCAVCDAPANQVVQGRELEVTALEILQ